MRLYDILAGKGWVLREIVMEEMRYEILPTLALRNYHGRWGSRQRVAAAVPMDVEIERGRWRILHNTIRKNWRVFEMTRDENGSFLIRLK